MSAKFTLSDGAIAEVSLELITPQFADTVLAGKNDGNRSLSPIQVNRLRRAIDNGEWRTTHQGIAFDAEGKLIDGQHRLAAISLSGTPLEMFVFRGLAKETSMAIDTAKARSVADALRMAGESNCNTLAAVLSLLWGLENGSLANIRWNPMSQSEGLAVLERSPGVQESVEACGSTALRQLISRSQAAFLHYVFSAIDSETTDEFFRQLETGAGLTEGHPVLHLRNRLAIERQRTKGRLHVRESLALAIKAWNFVRRGQIVIKRLQWVNSGPNQEQFPEAK